MNEVNDPEVGKPVTESVAADDISSVDGVTVTKTFYSDQILAKTVGPITRKRDSIGHIGST